jgi:hypothetical protein
MFRRISALIIVATAAASLLIFAPNLDLPIGKLAASEDLQVKAKNLSLVCPGAIYQNDANNIGEFLQTGRASISRDFAGPTGTELVFEDEVFTVLDPQGVAAQGSALLTANQTQLVASASANGLAGAACQNPSSDIWLVGGSTATGRESLLILRNPSPVDATVDLQIFGEEGLLQLQGLTGISVASGKSVVLPMSGLAPKAKTFVTHITSKGGAVAAWLQVKSVRGLQASGLDYISPSMGASLNQVIPGIFIRGAADAAALAAANSDYADLAQIIRVFVPGETEANVKIQILGANAKTFGTVIVQTLKAGSVTDVSISGLTDGDYVAVLDSDVPVQAAARLSRTNKTKVPATDFTWLQAAQPIDGVRVISVPAVGISKLSVVNPTSAAVQTIVVAPGSTYRFDKPAAALFANLILDVDGMVTNIPVIDYQNAGGAVKVSVR